MKKIVFFILLLTLSFRLTAQIDYLEPVKHFTTYTGELGEYYRNVFSLLNTGFQQQPYARFVAIPSFSPEYAMSVEKKGGRYCLVSNTLSRTYWQAEKGTVTVDTRSVVISSSLYQSLGAIFRTVTSQVQDLDGSTAGLDGVVYYFTSTDAKGTNQMGRKWSCIHYAVNSHKHWKDNNQRQEKNNLSGQRHNDTEGCFSNRSKKAGGHWLDTICEGKKHKDPQIIFGKFKIKITSTTEHAYDVVGEKLETEKERSGYNCTGGC